MGDLRDEFRETSRARIAELRALLERELDRDAIATLSRHFHAFAGQGGTYGYARVSELGDEGEGLILPVERGRENVTPQLVERWRELVESIARQLEAEGEEPHFPEAPTFDVLLVEDDPEIVASLVPALEEEGMTVRTCATRADALDEIAARAPDAMIIDVHLPDGSGFDVLDALRAASPSAGAIVISARDTFIDQVRALRDGADAFAGKPLDVPSLVRRVSTFRERHERPPARILAVEDEPTQTLLTQRFLGKAGYDVAVCSDPARFEEMLEHTAPDLLLMDVHLRHDVSGYDLVRFVRQSERFATLPVIFVTGETPRKAAIAGAHSGGDLVVTKPVDWDLLLTQIEALLARASAVRELTDRDPLTGLLTRSAFESRARQQCDGTPRRNWHASALVLIDLDRFKSVNDVHGHVAGDRVLAALGTLLRRRLRQCDLAGRYGGEEVALLLDEVNVENAAHVVERLLDEFRALEHDPAGSVTFSAGVTTLADSFEAAFRRADAALYEAKRAGRARVVAA